MKKYLTGALLLLTGAAHADDMPANQLRIGLYAVSYASHAEDVSGPFTPPGINMALKNVRTPYFGYTRQLTPHWELELAAGVPPTTRTIGKGPAKLGSVPFDGQLVATAKWFSPTLLLNYRFGSDSDAVRPFAGAGVNYTAFFDRNSLPAGDAVTGGPTRIRLSRSTGPAVTAGLSYRLAPALSVTASCSRVRVNSDYQSETAGIVRRTRIHFSPTAWVVALGYAF